MLLFYSCCVKYFQIVIERFTLEL